MKAPETACWNSCREKNPLPVEDEKAPANAENQEAPVGDRAAVETTAAKAPLVDPSRETETEELEEIEEAPPVEDGAQGYTEQNAETEAQDAEPVQRYAETDRTGKDRSACNRRNQSIAPGSTYTAAGDLRRRKAAAGASISTAGSRACAQHDKGRTQAFLPSSSRPNAQCASWSQRWMKSAFLRTPETL